MAVNRHEAAREFTVTIAWLISFRNPSHISPSKSSNIQNYCSPILTRIFLSCQLFSHRTVLLTQRIMMKSCIMSLVVMISFLLVASCSCGRVVPRIAAPDSPSAFDTENTRLSSRDSPSGERKKKIELSTSNMVDGELKFLPKGAATPSGHRPNIISVVTERRLSTSNNSPGVGHMQMFRRKSHKITESDHSHTEDHVQRKGVHKRKLGSNPSPGDGN